MFSFSGLYLVYSLVVGSEHSRPQRPCSFWSAPRIAASGLVKRHSGFEWICKHNRLRPEPIRFVRLKFEHAQSDGKSVNRGLPVLDQARGRDSWCWPNGARPLLTRMGSEVQSVKLYTSLPKWVRTILSMLTVTLCTELWRIDLHKTYLNRYDRKWIEFVIGLGALWDWIDIACKCPFITS